MVLFVPNKMEQQKSLLPLFNEVVLIVKKQSSRQRNDLYLDPTVAFEPF